MYQMGQYTLPNQLKETSRKQVLYANYFTTAYKLQKRQ